MNELKEINKTEENKRKKADVVMAIWELSKDCTYEADGDKRAEHLFNLSSISDQHQHIFEDINLRSLVGCCLNWNKYEIEEEE